MPVNLNVNSKLRRFATEHKPIKVLIGGRGSGKSIGACDIMTGIKMGGEAENILCIREFANSIGESIHAEMVQSLDRIRLGGWTIQEKNIIAPNGAKTVYKGAKRDPNALKSMTGFRYALFDEAQTASEDSIQKIVPTILREPGRELWLIANPESSGDPFSQRFIIPFKAELDRDGFYEDDLHMIVVLNWRDNPWWNEAQEVVRVHDYETLPRAVYDWIWEGDFNDSVDGSIILPEWFDAAIDAHLQPQLLEAMKPAGAIIASHDPFDDGGDAAGFAIRHGSVITQVRTKFSGQIDECCDWATGLARQSSADWFVWDGDGMGTGLKRQISDAFKGTQTRWHMFSGAKSGKGQDNADAVYNPAGGHIDGHRQKTYRETFKNNRSQYYFELARRFKNTHDCVVNGAYTDPDDMISLSSAGIDDMVSLRSQVCRIPAKPNAQGLLQIMAKNDMAKLGIASPNDADALMMSMMAPPDASEVFEIDFEGWN
jgi:phage terminase large subunit